MATMTSAGAQWTDFAALVRFLGERKGLMQEEFARQLDVTVGTLSGWENGRHRPLETLRKRLVRLAIKARLNEPCGSSPQDVVPEQ